MCYFDHNVVACLLVILCPVVNNEHNFNTKSGNKIGEVGAVKRLGLVAVQLPQSNAEVKNTCA